MHGALACGYTGAGTVEFLVGPDGQPYFMEMNARIQVEHPVTEMITGVDLVREQLLVAGGAPLGLAQDDISCTGAAIECRINAEDPVRGFAPTPGRLEVYVPPAGPWTRWDTGYRQGDQVSPHYDSLLGKLIVWAPTRAQALARMDRALAELRVKGPGVRTTAASGRGSPCGLGNRVRGRRPDAADRPDLPDGRRGCCRARHHPVRPDPLQLPLKSASRTRLTTETPRVADNGRNNRSHNVDLSPIRLSWSRGFLRDYLRRVGQRPLKRGNVRPYAEYDPHHRRSDTP